MKSLFKKRETPFTYHKYYTFIQEKWAEKMNVLTAGLSRTKLIYLLVLFTVLTAGYFIYNIYAALSKSNSLQVNNTAVISKIKSINIKK
jgi:hypothetical protein